MSGNFSNIEWDNSLVKRVAKDMLDKYRLIPASENKPGLASTDEKLNAFYTPYQFTIPILEALYLQFEKGDEGAAERLENQLREGSWKANNPKDRIAAKNTDLRAIAYLSWEAESRVFLVRRVFPTYFDFLSVSHIPEGWGVSSKMLTELQGRFRSGSEGRAFENGQFFAEVDMADANNYRYTLPYLAEQERLRYEQVLVLPVFKSGRAPESDRDMLGTFLFFVGEGGGLPMGGKVKVRFQRFAEPLCKATTELVEAHNHALNRDPMALAKRWREIRSDKDYKPRIAEVILKCHHPHDGKRCGDLENAAREFLKALTIPNYYAIRDSSAETDHETAVFLVTARQSDDLKFTDFLKDFKRRLLRIVTESLSQMQVKCEVNIKPGDPEAIKPGDPGTRNDFHLNADKWDIPE